MNIDNLKSARERKNLTQKQASELLEMSIFTYRNYEQGKREPSNDQLVKMAELYDCTTDYLLGHNSDNAYKNITDIENERQMEQQMLSKYFQLKPKERALFLKQLVDVIQNQSPMKDVKVVERKAGDIEDELIDMYAVKTDDKLSSGQ